MADPHRPDFSLAGKTVLITGASRGIGRAIAQGCWRAGADLVLAVRDPADVADIVSEAQAGGRRALAVKMDIADVAQIQSGVAEGHKAMGRIDVLVNNVGIGPEAPAEHVKEADFDLTVNVNLKGTFFVSQTVGRLMIAQGGGRIVNISSQAGTVALRTRVGLLHDQGGDQSSHALPRFRMGDPQDQCEQRGADLHLDRWHKALSER